MPQAYRVHMSDGKYVALMASDWNEAAKRAVKTRIGISGKSYCRDLSVTRIELMDEQPSANISALSRAEIDARDEASGAHTVRGYLYHEN